VWLGNLAILPIPSFWEFIAIGLVGVWLWASGDTNETRSIVQTCNSARADWHKLSLQWNNETSDEPFNRKLSELRQARQAYEDLPSRRQRELHRLEQERRKRQLERHLNQQRIESARIPGIGPGRSATLASYGIETAADVTSQRVMTVPGFGNQLTSQLVAWRRRKESEFVFDSRQGIDARDLQLLENELGRERGRLEQTLGHGALELRAIQAQITKRREIIGGLVGAAKQALAQAEADLAAL
jgi:DNA-binding helix-hairpin-helix protein with protein kinase domain